MAQGVYATPRGPKWKAMLMKAAWAQPDLLCCGGIHPPAAVSIGCQGLPAPLLVTGLPLVIKRCFTWETVAALPPTPNN